MGQYHFLVYVNRKIFRRSRTSNSKRNRSTWSKFVRRPDIMRILNTCKFEDVLIKREDSLTRTMPNNGCLALFKDMYLLDQLFNTAEFRTRPSPDACSSCQQV